MLKAYADHWSGREAPVSFDFADDDQGLMLVARYADGCGEPIDAMCFGWLPDPNPRALSRRGCLDLLVKWANDLDLTGDDRQVFIVNGSEQINENFNEWSMAEEPSFNEHEDAKRRAVELLVGACKAARQLRSAENLADVWRVADEALAAAKAAGLAS